MAFSKLVQIIPKLIKINIFFYYNNKYLLQTIIYLDTRIKMKIEASYYVMLLFKH